MAFLLNPRIRLRIVAVIDVIKGIAILSVGLGILRAQSHVLEHGGQALMRMHKVFVIHETRAEAVAAFG